MPEWLDDTQRAVSRILRLGPRILRDDPADGRLRTLACYLGLELRSVLKPAADGKPRRKRILDAQIEFFDYRHLRYIFVEIFLTRDYLFASGTARPFIVDCGANLGLSIVFFKRLYPECRILAFEPDPETFSLLKGNVEANGFEDITLVNKAVSSAEGVVEFYSDPQGPGAGMGSVVAKRGSAQPIKVPSVRLSEYVDEPVDLLKIDVEGAESQVIRELVESGKSSFIRQMAIEYHHHIDPGEDRLADFLGLLERGGFGYQVRGDVRTPMQPGRFQDLMIYVYKKKG